MLKLLINIKENFLKKFAYIYNILKSIKHFLVLLY